MAWLNDLEDVQGFRESMGVVPGGGGPVQRRMAAMRSAERAAMQADAVRAEQAEAARAERLTRMLAESGASSFEELRLMRHQQRMTAERIADREDAERAAQLSDQAAAKRAALYAAGHRPKSVADILAGAAMFP